MQELHILLAANQKQKFYLDTYAVGIRYGKVLGDNSVRTNSPNIEKAGRSESCEKMNRQFCDFIFNSETFSNKVYAIKMKRSEDLAFSDAEKFLILTKPNRILGHDLITTKVHLSPIKKTSTIQAEFS